MLLNHQYRVLLPVCGTWCDTTQTHLRDAHAGQGKPWADSVVLHGALKEQTQQATHSRPLTGTSAVQTPTHSNNHHGFLCRDICCCFLALGFSVLRAHRTRSAWRMCRCAQQLSGAQSCGQKCISGGKFLFRLIVSDRTMVFNFVIFLTLYKSYIIWRFSKPICWYVSNGNTFWCGWYQKYFHKTFKFWQETHI